MTNYVKIKNFGNLVGLSVRTLQYYDELDLLKPAKITKQGHRLYDDASFSKVFMITSLKRIGMSLKDIQNVLNKGMSLADFILKEKQRTETELVEIHHRLMKLKKIEDYLEKGKEITPELITILGESDFSDEVLTEIETVSTNFDLQQAQKFFERLEMCYEKDLPVEHPKVQECLTYWRTVLSFAPASEWTEFAENYYAEHPNEAYGMKAEWYQYLLKRLNEAQ